MPLLSIIIPTFNSESFLKIALESILNQTFSNYEVVIMDGGSKDDTLSVAQSYNDARIKIFCEPDKGVYDAMNKAMDKAQGEWLFFMGSDDSFYNSSVLKNVTPTLLSTKNHVVYGNVLIQGDSGWAKDGQVYNGKFTFQRLLRGNICHQSIFYRNSFVKKQDLKYDLKYPICADWDFNIQCGLKTSFTYINCIIANFNAGGISTGKTNNDPFLAEKNQKYGHLFKTSNYPTFLLPLKKLVKWIKKK